MAVTTRADPAPLFDLVTGFPPDDCLDVTVPLPLTLAVWMTVLESTGHAADVAVLRRIHIEQARETARRVQTVASALTGPAVPASTPLRITHIVEERVRGVGGLRPHVHVFVGATVRCPDGTESAVDLDELAAVADAEVLADHHDRLVAATTRDCGLVWDATAWSPCEVVEPAWLVERAARARDEPACRGPWPRRQIATSRPA